MKENKDKNKVSSEKDKKTKSEKQDVVSISPGKINDPSVNRYSPGGIKLS